MTTEWTKLNEENVFRLGSEGNKWASLQWLSPSNLSFNFYLIFNALKYHDEDVDEDKTRFHARAVIKILVFLQTQKSWDFPKLFFALRGFKEIFALRITS